MLSAVCAGEGVLSAVCAGEGLEVDAADSTTGCNCKNVTIHHGQKKQSLLAIVSSCRGDPNDVIV